MKKISIVVIAAALLAVGCNQKQALKNESIPVSQNQTKAASERPETVSSSTAPAILGKASTTPAKIMRPVQPKAVQTSVDNSVASQQDQQVADSLKTAQQQAEEQDTLQQALQIIQQNSAQAAAAKQAQTDVAAKAAAIAATQAAQAQAQQQALTQEQKQEAISQIIADYQIKEAAQAATFAQQKEALDEQIAASGQAYSGFANQKRQQLAAQQAAAVLDLQNEEQAQINAVEQKYK